VQEDSAIAVGGDAWAAELVPVRRESTLINQSCFASRANGSANRIEPTAIRACRLRTVLFRNLTVFKSRPSLTGQGCKVSAEKETQEPEGAAENGEGETINGRG
jgi:hypothetical protein